MVNIHTVGAQVRKEYISLGIAVGGFIMGIRHMVSNSA
jgi:hypothetical protein